ncbi:MAG: extracellular solute-binding protein [Alphaproteobacteria bacterium]|nr:extracellular solute-binding protein [Alphaproteobacteria bacterium]
MNRVRLIDRLHQGKLTRREITEAAALFGVASVALPMAPRPARAGGELLYFTWAGFEDPGLFPAYVEKYGSPPESTFYGDEYEGIEKLKAGFEADVVCPCIDVMPRWQTSGLQPIDESKLLYLDDVFEPLKGPADAFIDGQRYFVPTYWGFSGICYNPTLSGITPEEESWRLLYDERFKGKIGIWDSTDAVIPVASLAAGDLDDPYRPDGDRFEKVKELMRKQKNLVRFYWNDTSEVSQALASGELLITFCWAGTYGQMKKEGLDVVWAKPKEGLISFNCGLARSNRTKDAAAVYDFLNASMSPEAGKYMIETFNYGASNKKSFNLVDPSLLTEINLNNPEEGLANSHGYQFVPHELKQLHINTFDEIKAGV